MSDLTSSELYELARRLWRDCIRPAARYDRWGASRAYGYEGLSDAAESPVFRVRDIRHIVVYWPGEAEMWLVLQEVAEGACRQYEFGRFTSERIADVHWDWDEYEGDQSMHWTENILACPVEWPEQLEMAFDD